MEGRGWRERGGDGEREGREGMVGGRERGGDGGREGGGEWMVGVMEERWEHSGAVWPTSLPSPVQGSCCPGHLAGSVRRDCPEYVPGCQ